MSAPHPRYLHPRRKRLKGAALKRACAKRNEKDMLGRLLPKRPGTAILKRGAFNRRVIASATVEGVETYFHATKGARSRWVGK